MPYLLDTKIKVTFNGIKINTERQLFEGKLVTTYDVSEKNLQFVQEGIGEIFGDAGVKTNKIDFEITEIKKDENGRIIVIGKPDEKTGIAPQVVLPAGSDYQLSDASGKVWTLDEQGEVTSVGEKADTKLAQNQEKNNLPKGQPKPENFQVEWDFSPSEFAFDTSGEIPYKALVKGKNDVFQVVIKQKDTLRYSFHFQTDKGLKVESKKEKEGVFEISRKGLFDFADEELWVVAKNAKTEKEEVIGKCVLVHLSEKEVNVTLIPIAENLQIDTEKIKAIYAKVGVKLTISTDKVFPVTETIDTKNAFGDLSTYSPEQQAIIAWYKSERGVKSDTYYVFVGKQEGSQVGYMRLGGQFGFVMDANERTIAHELGHGIFKLEHPFKKDETKKGTFRTLMDYAQETTFAHSDWKQINDPKLKIYAFQGQSQGKYVEDEDLDFVEKDIVAQINKYLENIITQDIVECEEWKNVSGKIGAYNLDFVKIKSCNNAQETMFQLTNGMYVYRANRDIYKKYANGEIPDTELVRTNRFYFYDTQAKKWVEFTPERRKFYNKMPDEMKKIIGELVNFVVPVEEGFILVTGRDFNQEEQSRLMAAGFIIWEVSGGKVVKGVKIAGKISASAVEGMVKTFKGKAVRETSEKAIELVGKYDWGLVRKYFKHIQTVTGRDVHPKQIEKLKEALRKKEYKKLNKQDIDLHRADFNKKRDKLIEQWEKETGQKWPTYTKPVYSKKGTIIKDIGDKYDAHHIIENQYGGNNEWWNIHPAKFPNEHQKLIHGKDSPSRELFK